MSKKKRISVSQLARYLSSRPTTQQTIVQDAKQKPIFKAAWYDQARSAINAFVKGGFEDNTPLGDALSKLAKEVATTEHQKQVIRNDIEAINGFVTHKHLLTVEGMKAKKGPHSGSMMTISGVSVSVRPEIILRGEYRKKNAIGAIKLYFGKTHPLGTTAGEYISTLVYMWAREEYGDSVSPRHCQVFDVMNGTVFTTPKATKSRMRDLAAACKQISILWDAA